MPLQVLPSMYSFIGAAFFASPSQLGSLAAGFGIMQAATAPVTALLGTLNSPGTIANICMHRLCWVFHTSVPLLRKVGGEALEQLLQTRQYEARRSRTCMLMRRVLLADLVAMRSGVSGSVSSYGRSNEVLLYVRR